ncbi:MAG: tetratricopeptide repeat protein [Saprospiraceae bacterium]|nr:tetratricopeptide repeat protein [Saprospiraceae bacterium]
MKLRKHQGGLLLFALWLFSLGPIFSQSSQEFFNDSNDDGLADSTINHWIEAGTKKWQQLLRSDIDSSLIYSRRVVTLSRIAANDSLLFQSLRRVANSLIQKGTLDTARMVCGEMAALLDQSDYYQVFRYHQTLGLVEFYEGQYQKALKNHFSALEAARSGDLESNIPAALAEISRVFDEMGQPLKALDYARQDLDFTLQNGSDRSKFIAHYNLANRYVDLDSFKQASDLYDIADSLAQLLAIPVFTDAIILSKGRLYQQMGDHEKAVPLLRQAASSMQKSGNRRGYLTARINLGRAMNGIGNYQESVTILKDTYNQLIKDGFQHLAQSCREAYAKALYESGNAREAYKLLDDYRTIQDSIRGEETSRTINELEIQYQTAEKEKEILAKEIALTQKTQERNRLISLAIFLALGLIIVYFFQKQKIGKNKLLAEQGREIQNQKIETLEKEKKILAMASMIEGQENERTRIAKDLHDGLGVLLSSVRRQVQNVQQELQKLTEIDLISDTEKLINTACEEVRRISHDMMPDALINLGLSEAIRDLAYQVEFDHQIKTHVVIPELKIQETLVINIYRIVQEFCNNSVKYSNAENIYIRIVETSNALNINLADDGVGFDLEAARSGDGIGIKSIESRVNYMNGYLDITSSHGTSYDIIVPRLGH